MQTPRAPSNRFSPQLLALPPQRVLTLQLIGDPDLTAPKAASALFAAFYRLQNDSQRQWFPSPHIRARWPLPLTTPRNQWIGQSALAVGNQTVMPAFAAGVDVPHLEDWYCDVPLLVLALPPLRP
jgi:hypothetical protein